MGLPMIWVEVSVRSDVQGSGSSRSARAVEVAVGAKFQSGFAQETYLRRGAMAVRAHFLAKGSDFVLQASYAVEVAVEMAE